MSTKTQSELSKFFGPVVATGAERICVRNLNNEFSCFKISKKIHSKETRREIKYFKFLKKRGISSSFIPSFISDFETKDEVIIEQELIADHPEQNLFAFRVEEFVADASDNQLTKLEKLFRELYAELKEKNIIISDLHAGNMMIYCDVSKVQLINASVPNGAAALYEATKAWRNFQIKGEPSQALTKFGYSNIEEAKKDLAVRAHTSTQLSFRPNVVFTVMESMSGDIFNSHDSLANNTLGSLETAMEDAVVFRKGVSIENGTFPSLEGLLFDTPISPISQSIYGRKELSFSQVRAFKEAGYRTIFLTGCPEPWRQINDTFKFYGFEEIYGQAAIGEKFPNAEKSSWGIGDKWMFKFAEDLLKEAEGTGRPVFIMMLSTTNHPPFKVPDGEQVSKVDISKLPKTINLEGSYDGNMEMLLKTYQYAANSLGNFILDLRNKGWLKNTIVAATGDHNARMRYQSEGNWHHVFGVPVLFWLPDQNLKASVDTDRWVSHRDILPSLLAMSTGKILGNEKGRNLFAKDIEEGAVSFIGWSGSGFVIGKPGLVTLNSKNLECYGWQDDRLVKVERCSKEQEKMGKEARAQRAISEYIVRKGLNE